ncbi:MAG: hypothetical protein AAGD33_23670 [Actinomycetota bacterium]
MLDQLFAWAEADDDPGYDNVLPSAVAIVRDRSNRSPYRINGGSDPVVDYAAAGEVVFNYDDDKLIGTGQFAFTDRSENGRVGPRDWIRFEIDRDGSARMRLLSWGNAERELTRVVIEDGPFEGTFLRGYYDRGVDGAGLVTMSFDRAQVRQFRLR